MTNYFAESVVTYSNTHICWNFHTYLPQQRFDINRCLFCLFWSLTPSLFNFHLYCFELPILCSQSKMILVGSLARKSISSYLILFYNNIKLLQFDVCNQTPMEQSNTDPQPVSFWFGSSRKWSKLYSLLVGAI